MIRKDNKGRKIQRRGPSVFHQNARRKAVLKGVGLTLSAIVVIVMGFFTAELINKGPDSSKAQPISSSGSTTSMQTSQTIKPTQNQNPDTNTGLHAFYLPISGLDNNDALLGSAADAGFNAVIFDLKADDGVVYYQSNTEFAKKSHSISEKALSLQQIASLKNRLESKGFVAIPRLYAFRDPLSPFRLSSAKITLKEYPGLTWLDNSKEKGGKPWLNPYEPDAHKYIIELAVELADMGFENIMLDGVQFPDRTYHAYYGESELTAMTKSEVLKKFIAGISTATGDDCRIIHSMPGLSVFGDVTEPFGGNPVTMGADAVAPLLLPSTLGNNIKVGETTLSDPSSNPSDAIELSAGQVKLRLELMDNKLRPSVMLWLQAFDYTNQQIRSQIDAAQKVFGKDASFILFNKDGNYDFGAFN